MKERTFNNADSFAMSFDEEWQRIECEDESLKIKKIIDLLSDIIHLFNQTQRQHLK